MKPASVVDTNVGVVANDQGTNASEDCVIACVDLLEEITDGRRRVVVDSGRAILEEYMRQLAPSGQPGPGDAFLRWLLQNQANPERCEVVEIIPEPSGRGYREFPDDPELERFDRDDRKFVAVALASPSGPEIANATDSDWWLFRDALENHGVRLHFLCEDQIPLWKKKERSGPGR